MTNLFKKAAVATDLHIGLKSNSVTHNEDCLHFVEWFIKKAKSENCETAIWCGDWHNHRASINILSLHYSMKCLELLNNAFDKVYFLPGNHDLFYRENRSVHSVAWAGYLPNVHVVNDVITEGDVTLCPWLVGDESEQIKKIKSKYTFGHFELPNFYMNSQVLMPDHGNINLDHFGGSDYVFSGHFHKRQAKKNVWYIGNAFPHNYADAGDDARGMMILDWGNDPEFHSWDEQPLYRVYKLSDILENPQGLLLPKSHIRVNLDIEISYEEATFIRESLIPEYKLREMSLIPMKAEQVATDATANVNFESVDQIIMTQINSIESEFYDPKVLMEIYNTL
jgi:predicted phosphodiesterase